MSRRPGSTLPEPGTELVAEIDWDRRHRLMRMHTCLHLLCAVVPGAVTGGQVSDGRGRLDFDVPGSSLDKEAIASRLNELIAEGHPAGPRWITDDELAAQPELVRTMSVKPPSGMGRVRLMEIAGVDLQPCGGTHVRNTAEIGPVVVDEDREQGQAEPPRNPRLRGVTPDALRPSRSACRHRLARRTLRRSACPGRRFVLQIAGNHPDRAGGLRSRPHPGCGILRYRRHLPAWHQPAAHDPVARSLCAKGRGTGHRRRRPGRRLRQRRVVFGWARLVDAAPLRASRRRGPRRRPAQMARRGTPGRRRAAAPAATPFHGAASTRHWCATSERCSTNLGHPAASRSSMPGPPAASTAPRPEARPGLRSGHIPGSRNCPYELVTDPQHPAAAQAPRSCAGCFARPASRSTARSSPAAARGSPPARSPSRCI